MLLMLIWNHYSELWVCLFFLRINKLLWWKLNFHNHRLNLLDNGLETSFEWVKQWLNATGFFFCFHYISVFMWRWEISLIVGKFVRCNAKPYNFFFVCSWFASLLLGPFRLQQSIETKCSFQLYVIHHIHTHTKKIYKRKAIVLKNPLGFKQAQRRDKKRQCAAIDEKKFSNLCIRLDYVRERARHFSFMLFFSFRFGYSLFGLSIGKILYSLDFIIFSAFLILFFVLLFRSTLVSH